VTRTLAALLTATLALPATAAAVAHQHATLAPPGNSAVSQYLETVPNSMGSSPPGAGGSHTGALAPGTRHGLDRLGSDGRTLAAVVDATTPPAAVTASASPSIRARVAPAPSAVVSGAPKPLPQPLSGDGAPSPVSSVLAAATGRDGGGGLGIFLPGLMLAGVLALIARVVLRRRADTQ
jgi:hypothetical protein